MKVEIVKIISNLSKSKNVADRLLRNIIYVLEHIYINIYKTKKTEPVIFIVGTPRSGTTLLYQLLVQRFKFAYFSNIAVKMVKSVALNTYLSFRILKNYRSDFKSKFGYSKGNYSPAEAGEFWNRWFPCENKDGFNFITEGYLNLNSINTIKKTIYKISNIFKAPFINKNVKNSVRINLLKEIFPSALFIYLKRDILENAASILDMRVKLGKNLNDWYAVMPKQIDEIKNKPYHEQIIGQIYYLHQNIISQFESINNNDFITVNYEELCRNPEKVMIRIQQFILSKGYQLMNNKNIPVTFERKSKVEKLTNKDKKIFKLMIRKYYGEEQN